MPFAIDAEYVALIGDVVRSRRAGDRAALQHALVGALAELGTATGACVAFTLSAGDEVQGLYRADRSAGAVMALTALSEAVFPHRLAFGLGRGTLSTAFSAQVGRMDGPVFHAARAALERARAERVWARLAGFGARADEAGGALAHLMGAVRTGWTARQAEVVRAVRAAPSQLAAARALGVSASVVSEALAAARYAALREGEAALARLVQGTGG